MVSKSTRTSMASKAGDIASFRANSKAGVRHTAPLISGPWEYRHSFSFLFCLVVCLITALFCAQTVNPKLLLDILGMFLIYFYLCVYGRGGDSMWMLAPVTEDFQELILLKLALRNVLWVLGIDLLSSARTVCTLNCWVISLPPLQLVSETCTFFIWRKEVHDWLLQGSD